MEANDTASRTAAATAALAELLDGELRSMGPPDTASLEDRALRRGHEAMARALGRALQRYDPRVCSSLPGGAKAHDRRRRTLAARMGDVTFEWTRAGRGRRGCCRWRAGRT